jgi:hypothetical protein
MSVHGRASGFVKQVQKNCNIHAKSRGGFSGGFAPPVPLKQLLPMVN